VRGGRTLAPQAGLRLGEQEQGVGDGALEPEQPGGEGVQVDGVEVPVDGGVLPPGIRPQPPLLQALPRLRIGGLPAGPMPLSVAARQAGRGKHAHRYG
jgi:hypothetical protein